MASENAQLKDLLLNNVTSRKSDVTKIMDSGKPIYIIGKNEDTKHISEIFNITGIIDDFAEPGSMWFDIPVLKMNELPGNSVIINCSTSISPVSVNNRLMNINAAHVINISHFIEPGNEIIKLPWFVSEMRNELTTNINKWEWLYNGLADDESKEVFRNVVNFRYSANPEFMKDYSVRLEQQYFEPFMNYQHEIFVDAGGFDGDTSELFCRNYPDYLGVHFFEPSHINMSRAKNRLKGFRDINYHEVGVSDKTETVNFSADAGSASQIAETGSELIKLVKLDDEVKGKVSFIKMDLEGWELKALKGSENHIINDYPKLAIAVYHSAADFYQIPEYILSVNPNYKIFIRHYTEGWSETIMYFLPA